MNKKGGKIAIKLPTEFDEIQKKKTPGPGEYNPQHLNLSDAGSFFLSKYKNTSSPRYHNPEHYSIESKSRVKTLGPISCKIIINHRLSILKIVWEIYTIKI